MDIEYTKFLCLKGEFEAEGLTRVDVAAEALFAARKGLSYLVKISGAEAKSDVNYIADLGINALVCPMIESPFAMEKYIEMLPSEVFEHIGVTIETITAVANIETILSEGKLLTDVTIGRSDLTASWGGDNVESERTITMVKVVARAAKARGLQVTMGGSVSGRTIELLQRDSELCDLLDYIETRKAVMSVQSFINNDALQHALKLEEILLIRRGRESKRVLPAINSRLDALSLRV
jgi:2-keto-3-deoxy-L-rhamnonate aldolase RhmA